jgi:RNA polymerase sigma-70 factor, ECF subfamily
MGADSDAVLLKRSSMGDRSAFDEFTRRHQVAVFRYLRSSLGGELADVEDALQETLLSAWRASSSFRGTSMSARAWLLTIARRAYLGRRRSQREEYHDSESLEALGLAAGWGSGGENDILNRLTATGILQSGLAALDAEDREILLLRDGEGLSGQEAASVLDLSLSAMKSRLHRARLRFVAAVRKGESNG